MTVDLQPGTGSRIRKKSTVEVELILDDGTTLGCEVFVTPGERVLDLLNGPLPFMPVRLENQEILLVRKTSVVACKPLDQPD
jgi:hypothetical protein